MLVISESQVQRMLDLAKESHPIEACGIIAAKKSNPGDTRLVAMRNVANSDSFFQFDPADQFKLWKEMDQEDERLLVVFHSHTSSEAFPSKTDIRYAADPDSHYVILSTDTDEAEQIRSFRISTNKVVEESIRIRP